MANEWFLTQLIELSTHHKGNTLDLVFSNNPLFVLSQESLDTMHSDHGTHDAQEALPPTAGHGFDHLNYFSEDTDWI